MSPDVDVDGLVAALHAELVAAPADGTRIAGLVRDRLPLASDSEVTAVARRVRHLLGGLGPLEPLLDDPAVTEVMVNGPGHPVWVERHGQLHASDVVLDAAGIDLAIERIVGPLGLRVDRTSPTVDARLPDGSRVHVVVPPLAVDGPCVTIRRFGARAVTLAELCPPGVADLLAWAVRGRCNVLVAGGTGAGKTTLLNALAAAIPDGERIVTVEDAAELRLVHPHVVRLECRPASPAGAAVTPRELVRNALRMRPDRVVVGEVRGPEALDLLQAMNTGHEGALSTLHANGAADALTRLETMALFADVGLPLAAVRAQIESSLDLVVDVHRLPDGRRRVMAVAEVLPAARRRSTGGERVRSLADAVGLRALPDRPARAAGASAPDPSWVVR